MKTSCAFLLATAIGCAAVAHASPSPAPAHDLMPIGYPASPPCSVSQGICAVDRTSPPPRMRVADDYCTTRCDRQFKYCQYRGQPSDYCADRLKTCISRC
jgi:hypothetical protein